MMLMFWLLYYTHHHSIHNRAEQLLGHKTGVPVANPGGGVRWVRTNPLSLPYAKNIYNYILCFGFLVLLIRPLALFCTPSCPIEVDLCVTRHCYYGSLLCCIALQVRINN